MSLRVIKPGILDTVQDAGRYHYQHLGINPGGVMDCFATKVVNMLVGNNKVEAVIEMHFPAAAFLIEQEAMIAVGGADFYPTINGEPIPLWTPVIVNKNSVLNFEQLKSGARCYLAIKDGIQVFQWLNSSSTNLKATIGGHHGRALQKDDVIYFKKTNDYSPFLNDKDLEILNWSADTHWNSLPAEKIFVVPGHEWDWIDDNSKKNFLTAPFYISNASDRMGYHLTGMTINRKIEVELISSAVSFGTIQLLPDGQLIILMADHQTAGGYARVAHVVTAHLSKLAQLRPAEKINFSIVDVKTAENLLIEQEQHLLQLQYACEFRLNEYLNR